jgi:hypothetical protein
MKSLTIRTALPALLAGALNCLNAQAQTTVVSADPDGNPNGVYVVYSAAVDPASSTTASNYSLTNATGVTVPITGAALAGDDVTVTLNLGASLQAGQSYGLTINNVMDSSGVYISPNPATTNFTFGPNITATFNFDNAGDPLYGTNSLGAAVASTIGDSAAVIPGGFEPGGNMLEMGADIVNHYFDWTVPDLAGGAPIDQLSASFKMVLGSPINEFGAGEGLSVNWAPDATNAIGPNEGGPYWDQGGGTGLIVEFHTDNSGAGSLGQGIFVKWGGNSSANIVLFSPMQPWTNAPATSFSNALDVAFSVVEDGTFNMTYGANVVFTNAMIPGFHAQAGGLVVFASRVGFVAEYCWIDDVAITESQAIGPVRVRTQPADATAPENSSVTFTVGAAGAPPFTYQWFSNAVAIVDATNAAYSTPLTLYANNGDRYSVAVSNAFSGVLSSNAILTITKDTAGAHALSVGSVDGQSIGVLFDTYIDAASAGKPANYLVNGGAVSVTAASARANIANYGDPEVNYAPSYLRTVRLTLASTVAGGYTVTVTSNVLSRTGLRVPQTTLTGTVAAMLDLDLGTYLGSASGDPLTAGEAFSDGANQIEVLGGGSGMMGIGASTDTDHGNFAYDAAPRNGNFDVVADATFLTPTDPSAEGGVMARVDPTDVYSPAIAIEVFPAGGNNTYQTAMRASEADDGASWAATGAPANGAAPAQWPNNWLRLRRVGPTFYGYGSADGVEWTLIGLTTQDTNAFPAVEYVGLLATASNNDGRLCEADFSNWGPLSYPGAVVSITNDLRANYTNGQNGSQTFILGAGVSGPNVSPGDLTYQWQRAEPAAPTVFNNILDGTGNSNQYITPLLTVAADNGAEYRCIAFVGDVTTGHAATSTVATLTVTLQGAPPYMVSAGADGTFQQITIMFDGAVDGTTVTVPPATYTITPAAGGSPIGVTGETPVVNSSQNTVGVVLTLASPLSPGAYYRLSVSGVKDLAGNLIDNTPVPGGKQRLVASWALAYGYLKFERWQGPDYPSGTAITIDDITAVFNGSLYTNAIGNNRYPNSPDFVQMIPISGFPNGSDFYHPAYTSAGDVYNFGAQISGFFVPPTNGTYQFYCRGNDGNAIYVSGDSTLPDPTTVQPVAADNQNYTGPTSWRYSITNVSAGMVNGAMYNPTPITMKGGQPYGIVALFQQGTGGSFIEFTWGIPGAPTIWNGDSVNAGISSSYRIQAGLVTNTYNIKGTNIATYVDPVLSGIIASGPTDTTASAGSTATFSVSASATLRAGTASVSVPVLYQWARNGLSLSGATGTSYTTPVLALADNNSVFSVVMSVAGASFMTLTNSGTLSVLPSQTPPAFSGITRSGNAWTVSFTNGPSALLWTTNLQTPLSDWMIYQAGPVSPVTIHSTNSSAFFRLKQ